jgi:hypothetical protein
MVYLNYNQLNKYPMASDKITDALGVKEEWWNNRLESIKETWNSANTNSISDVILKEAEDQRTESFGDTGIKLSEYEIKMVTLGYLIGLTKALVDQQSASPDNDFLRFLIEMTKGKGGE